MQLPGEHIVWQWVVDLKQPDWPVQRLEATLSGAELARSRGFANEALRKSFIVSHGALRAVIASCFDAPPRDLYFATTALGKPYIRGPEPYTRLRFSLAHSDELALVAVAHGREVGADIERLRVVPKSLEIARRVFTPTELQRLLSTEGAKRDSLFLTCWTVKEAYLKARGEGLSGSFRAVGIAPDSDLSGGPVAIAGPEEDVEGWSAQLLSPKRGYIAAVAAQGHGWTLRVQPCVPARGPTP